MLLKDNIFITCNQSHHSNLIKNIMYNKKNSISKFIFRFLFFIDIDIIYNIQLIL